MATVRDPKRIQRILAKVQIYWERYPDLRLCQLLYAVASARFYSGDNLFNLEDTEIEKGLDKILKKL